MNSQFTDVTRGIILRPKTKGIPVGAPLILTNFTFFKCNTGAAGGGGGGDLDNRAPPYQTFLEPPIVIMWLCQIRLIKTVQSLYVTWPAVFVKTDMSETIQS